MRNFIFIILVFAILQTHSQSTQAFSQSKFEFVQTEFTYIFRLNNGDLITGKVLNFIDEEGAKGFEVDTDIGVAVIYESQIREIHHVDDYYKHRHRIFLQPTAHSIEDPFAGIFELAFLYGGLGYKFVSVTAGQTFIPGARDQLTMINGKITFLDNALDSDYGYLTMAAGVNAGFLGSGKNLYHAYFVASFTGHKSILNVSVFNKFGNRDDYSVFIMDEALNMYYPDGSFGLSLGLDTKFSHWHGLHFIGELWNSNITKPTHTSIMLGLRLAKTNFSADFGLAFFTQPFMIPFVSFVWTPF